MRLNKIKNHDTISPLCDMWLDNYVICLYLTVGDCDMVPSLCVLCHYVRQFHHYVMWFHHVIQFCHNVISLLHVVLSS